MEDGQGYRCVLGVRGLPCVIPQQYEAEKMLALSVSQTVSAGCQTSQVGYTPKVIVVCCRTSPCVTEISAQSCSWTCKHHSGLLH